MAAHNPHDDPLLTRLAGVVSELDAPPEHVVEAARSLFDWRDPDARLAELLHDSALEDPRLAGVRGAAVTRLLTFASDLDRLEVEVSAEDDDTRRIVGQLLPPRRAEVEVRHSGGARHVAVDERGRFIVEGVRAGLVVMRARLNGTVLSTVGIHM